jgi:hypothetical protein
VLVGTVDAQGRPSCCRAIAMSSRDDLKTITVFLPVATSQQTIQNLATTRRVAVTSSFPPDHCTTQLKGTTIDARIARDEERAFVRERLDAFATILNSIGVPRRLTEAVSYWPSFAVSVQVEDIFEQTPGPQAGKRIR